MAEHAPHSPQGTPKAPQTIVSGLEIQAAPRML